MDPRIDTVIDFWRDVVADGRWMQKDDAFDQLFREGFLGLHMDAAARRCDEWIKSPEGALALMVLLDQFPRNAFRGTAHMYATDGLARMFAWESERRDYMARAEEGFRVFFIFPFTHSEELADQEMSIALSARISEERAQRVSGHRDIIRRFGRFPHRNPVLGREHTREEEAFLAEGGFSG
ncbi:MULTISPECIES: DUF924 family protein [unclassified Luteimonas]